MIWTQSVILFIIHEIFSSEKNYNHRINFRVCSGYHLVQQRAIRVRAGTRTENNADPDVLGEASASTSPFVPVNMIAAIIMEQNIEDAYIDDRDNNNRPVASSSSEYVRYVIAHEVGHHLSLEDDATGKYNISPGLNGQATSVMSYTMYLDQMSSVFHSRHRPVYDLTP